VHIKLFSIEYCIEIICGDTGFYPHTNICIKSITLLNFYENNVESINCGHQVVKHKNKLNTTIFFFCP